MTPSWSWRTVRAISSAALSAFTAAIQGAREVRFTVLAMSLSLIAVFLPVLLMGDIIGWLFREFAVVLSVAVLISLIVSLTTIPTMCALVAAAITALPRPAVRDRAQGVLPSAGQRSVKRLHPGRPEDLIPGHERKLADFMAIVRANPAVAKVVGFTGSGQGSTANMFVALKPLAERKIGADQIINRLRGKLGNEPGACLYL